MHVFRWDLDKTYLATEIESVRGLIRAALEKAGEKRNVPGSKALLRALTTHDKHARVFVLSGSPTQMRDVLQEKLVLDGIVVDKLILKDNFGNLRRGRLRAVTDQLGYKLPTLLSERVGLGSGVTETLFGDDSEVDALVYAAYAAVVRGDLDERGLSQLLSAGHAYPDAIQVAVDAARKIGRADAVEDIFIHVERGVPLDRFKLLAGAVTPIFSWMQAALVLFDRGRLTHIDCMDVIDSVTTDAGLEAAQMAGLFQDAVRRGLVTGDFVRELLVHDRLDPLRDPAIRALDRLGEIVAPPNTDRRPDYLAFLRGT